MSVAVTRTGRRVGAPFVLVVVLLAALVSQPQTAYADAIRDREYWLDAYGFTQAWETTRGAGITVAVIDTGVDGTVRELQGAVKQGTDMSGLGSSNGQKPVGSDSEHGTLVATLLAGRGTGADNGVIGVAPEAMILPISVTLGDGSIDSDTQIANAVRWAADHGADVINLSLTRNSLSWPQSWDDAFQYAFDKDVVVVAAAGNRGAGTAVVGAPATIPGVVSVAGLDEDGEASDRASSQGATIAVSAPSEDLVGVRPGGQYVLWDGTSGAAPLVSGLAALIRAAHPDLDANNVINRLIATATPIGDPVPGPIYGYGAIDAAAAVLADVPGVTANPLGSLEAWVQTYRPTETVTPEPMVIPGPAPEPVRDDRPLTFAGPNLATITTFIIPAALVVGFGSIVILLAWAAVQYFRRVQGR